MSKQTWGSKYEYPVNMNTLFCPHNFGILAYLGRSVLINLWRDQIQNKRKSLVQERSTLFSREKQLG